MEHSLLENEKEFVVKSLRLAFQSMKLLDKCVDKQESFEDEEGIEEIDEKPNKKEIIETVNNNILLIEKENKGLNFEKDNFALKEEIDVSLIIGHNKWGFLY